MSNMFLNVVSTFKGDGLAAATRQLGAFGNAAGGLGGTLGKVGAALASFGVAAKAVQFTKESIDSARDLERNLFSVKTVFDEFAPAIEKFSLNAEGLGLAQKDAAKASVFLGSVLKQSGFSMEFVTSETQKLVELGVDLAATYGYDVQEALLGMTALFRGEYDPIEKFGVAMKQSEINSELAARGLDKLEGSARRNAEQTIRLELLYQRAADASGAFRAQSGNLYVEQKKLKDGSKEVDDIGERAKEFGKKAAAAFAVAGAAVGAFAISAVKAAAEDEAAQLKLAETIRSTTKATDDQIKGVEKYITQTSIAAGITDDQLRPAFSPRDMMFVDAVQSTSTQIARMMNVPAYYISADQNTSMTYANVQDERRQFVSLSLAPYVHAIQDRLSMDDITARGNIVKFVN